MNNIFFSEIHACVCIYIYYKHLIYTVHIFYVNKNFCILYVINCLTALVKIFIFDQIKLKKNYKHSCFLLLAVALLGLPRRLTACEDCVNASFIHEQRYI